MQASLFSRWFDGAVLPCLYHPCKLPCALGGSMARFCLVCTTHASFLALWVVRWRSFALFVPPMQASLRSRWFDGAVLPCLYHPLKLPCSLGGSLAWFCFVCTTHASFLALWVVRWRGFALFVPPMQASLRSRWFAGAVLPCLYHPLKLPCSLGGSLARFFLVCTTHSSFLAL